MQKEISDINLITWDDLSAEDYIKCKDLYSRIKEGMNNLKRTEYPILEFDFFLCGLAEKITEEIKALMFLKVNWWHRFWANCFSMSNALYRFIAKHNYQELQKQKQQKQQQQQERQKQQKDKP